MVRFLGDGGYYLIDMGSTNGTYLNGKRVSVPTVLTDGDAIRVGQTAMTFRIDDDAVLSAAGASSSGNRTIRAHTVKQALILVADIRGYTRFAESLPPEQLAQIMGQWFQSVTQAVNRHDGEVDKFIGDAVMARWSSVETQGAPPVVDVLRAASAIYHLTHALPAQFGLHDVDLRTGVGVHLGTISLGNLSKGSDGAFTAMGDAVNVAFRLESSTRELDTELVVSRDALDHLSLEMPAVEMRSLAVKGRTDPIEVGCWKIEDLDRVLSAHSA